MKKSIVLFAVLFSLISLGLSSCEKEIKDDTPEVSEGSFTFTFKGVTYTEVDGNISTCQDGYFQINGWGANGDHVSISCSEILEGETRSICDENEFVSCVDNGGLLISCAVGTEYWDGVAGTATRTSEKTITINGTFKDLLTGTLQEVPFTLEATAGLVSPFNCK